MPDIFADTAGWRHLVDPTQAYHNSAATLSSPSLQSLIGESYEEGSQLLLLNSLLLEAER